MTTVDIFIAYSHEDLAYKNEFKKFLRPMLREERISVWDDYDIEAGQEWDATIKERLYGAGIILLLVSSDSLASDYFYGKEVKVSLERHEKGQAVVVPVILRHCDWENTPLGGLEALPEKGRPVVEWPTRDQAWQDVVTRLRRAVESVAQRQATASAHMEQERRFAAAVEAAGHLFERGQWAEARAAFTDALALHQPGFTPDRAILQQQVAECAQQLERQAHEARKATFEQTLASADTLFAQENWAEATATYLQAESQYEPAFPLPEAGRHIRQRIAQCEQNMRPPAAPKVQKTPKTTPAKAPAPPTVGNSFPWYAVAGGLLAVLAIVLAVWQPWKPDGRDEQQHQPKLTPLQRPAPKSISPEEQAFNLAKNTGTIPAMQDFLARYPQGSFANAARDLLKQYQTQYQAWMITADLNIEDRDYVKAREYLEKMHRLDPTDLKVKRKLDRLK